MTQREAIELVTDAIEAIQLSMRTRANAENQAERVRVDANDLRFAVALKKPVELQKRLAVNAAAEAVLFLMNHVDE